MPDLIHDLLLHSAAANPNAPALMYQDLRLHYGASATAVEACASALLELGLRRGERVGVYLEKRPETVLAIFGAARAGGVFVPINPLLKADQVGYILRDCNVRILVTSAERLPLLEPVLRDCPDLAAVIVVG